MCNFHTIQTVNNLPKAQVLRTEILKKIVCVVRVTKKKYQPRIEKCCVCVLREERKCLSSEQIEKIENGRIFGEEKID